MLTWCQPNITFQLYTGQRFGDEEKEDVINDDSIDIKFNERGDEIEKSNKSDERSINASLDDTNNDNEVMETGLSVIYEAYF